MQNHSFAPPNQSTPTICAAGGVRFSGPTAETVAGYRTLNELRVLMTMELSATLRPTTLYTYNQQWDAVARHLSPETPLVSLDRTRLQAVVTNLASDGLRPATIKNTIRCLGRLLIRAVEDGVLGRNPLNQVTLPRLVRRPPAFLTSGQVAVVMREAHADSVDAEIFFALGIYLGLRKAESVSICWEHLDFDMGVARVVNTEQFTTKSGKNRVVPMCASLIELLRPHACSHGYLVSPRHEGYIGKRYRYNPHRLFDRVCKRAGLWKTVTPHVLRHTFASLAAQAGVSLFKIGSWLGHTMSEVTEIYAHLAPYDDDIERLNFGESKSLSAP